MAVSWVDPVWSGTWVLDSVESYCSLRVVFREACSPSLDQIRNHPSREGSEVRGRMGKHVYV